MRKADFMGSVSSGTMQEGDLIPTFLAVLEHYEYPNAPALREESDNLKTVDARYARHGIRYTEESQESASYLCHDLFDALDEIAPEGFYFGAHPGDGADYGFWHCEMLD